jgi:hypothetical protein
LNTTTRTCSQCGSPLILVESVTEHREGTLFPETTTSYRCSNKECQDEKDLQTAKRIKMREEKNQDLEQRKQRIADAKRAKNMEILKEDMQA